MNTFKLQLVLGALVVSLAGMAQAQGIRDAGSKIRGEYGSVPTSSGIFAAPRMAAPQRVVAQVPAERRSFSAQPGQSGDCTSVEGRTGEASVAAEKNRAQRSFSYEPGQLPTYRRPASAYQAPSLNIRDAGSKIRGF